MADITKTTKKVEKMVTVDEDVYTLSLTKDELQALLDVCASIGGDPSNTRRGVFSDFKTSILDIAQSKFQMDFGRQSDMTGKIVFTEKVN